MLLEESWMHSGCDGSQKSKIVMSLIAGQDTVVFENGMKQRYGVTGRMEGNW